MDWLITIPKTIRWSDYEKELATVSDGSSVMNYKTRYIPKGMASGDRCFIVHDGRVRGWMEVVGIESRDKPWRCTTTGALWPAGQYIQRSGEFHEVDGPEYTGFRGIRKYEPPSASKVATQWARRNL